MLMDSPSVLTPRRPAVDHLAPPAGAGSRCSRYGTASPKKDTLTEDTEVHGEAAGPRGCADATGRQRKRAPALRLVGLEARHFEHDQGSDFQFSSRPGRGAKFVFREKRVLVLLRCPVGMIQTPPLSHPPDGLLDEIPSALRRRNGLNSPENTKFISESKRIPVSHPFPLPTAGTVPTPTRSSE